MNVIYINTTVLEYILKRKAKNCQNDFPNFIGIFSVFYYWKNSNKKIQAMWITNLSLILTKKFEQTLQVLTFANASWKENFLGIDFRQIDQNLQNSGKLVPQDLFLIKLTFLK